MRTPAVITHAADAAAIMLAGVITVAIIIAAWRGGMAIAGTATAIAVIVTTAAGMARPTASAMATSGTTAPIAAVAKIVVLGRKP
jgi:hypothetical protein